MKNSIEDHACSHLEADRCLGPWRSCHQRGGIHAGPQTPRLVLTVLPSYISSGQGVTAVIHSPRAVFYLSHRPRSIRHIIGGAARGCTVCSSSSELPNLSTE